jgi:hypothetical protein
MLVWRSQSGGVPILPTCLIGWEPRAGATLVHRETDKGHIVGVGDPLVWTEPRRWVEIEDGWSVALVPGITFDPRHLVRLQGWADVLEVCDMQRRAWHAPVIRRKGGGRAFRVAYGKDWLPALTPEQERAEEICRAALDAANLETPMSVACQWAAELLSMTHHLTPSALAALALVDEVSAVGTLQVSASLEIEGATANGI